MDAPAPSIITQTAIYVRTATEDATSIGEQLRVCRAFAARHGYELREEHVFVDNGASGLTTGRTGRNQMMEEIEKSGGPPFQVLVVRTLSHLGRFADPRQLYYLLVRLEMLGVRVECTDESYPQPRTNSEVAEYILRQCETVFAASERRSFSRRSPMG